MYSIFQHRPHDDRVEKNICPDVLVGRECHRRRRAEDETMGRPANLEHPNLLALCYRVSLLQLVRDPSQLLWCDSGVLIMGLRLLKGLLYRQENAC